MKYKNGRDAEVNDKIVGTHNGALLAGTLIEDAGLFYLEVAPTSIHVNLSPDCFTDFLHIDDIQPIEAKEEVKE